MLRGCINNEMERWTGVETIFTFDGEIPAEGNISLSRKSINFGTHFSTALLISREQKATFWKTLFSGRYSQT